MLEILSRLRENGFAAFAVGGCVRDRLLLREPEDWDVTTSAPPEEVMRLFPKTAPTGIRYGTVTVFLGEGKAEVTTFRSDGAYRDGRRPESVAFGKSLEEDLSRRDFTMNALALAGDGTLFDPFGGREDIENGLIRCVGDPDARFAENRARILALAGDSVAAVGAGNPFRDLHDLRRAYVQAGAALEVIRAYRITDGAAAAMLRFENCYLGHLVYTAVRQDAWLYENCAAPALVRRIRSYDRKNGSSYAAVLQAFLLNERRPTETGQALGLHRNTVIYHISRMTELFGLNLDSPEMRVKLLLALNRSSLEEDGGRLKRK